MLRKTTRFTRHTYGDNGVFGRRNILSTSFAATDLGKAGNADTDAFLNDATAGTHTVSSQPSVPRNVTITASAGTGDVVVTGTNAEGATISETLTISGTSTVEGNSAFASITSVLVPAGATVDVGYGNKFGVNHAIPSGSAVRVLVIAADGTATIEAASATATGATVETNTVTPTTAPNGVVQLRLYTLMTNWHADPVNAQPNYGV